MFFDLCGALKRDIERAQNPKRATDPFQPDMTVYEGVGIPLDTALWLNNPSAFWLNPDGPLSDLTPKDWRARHIPNFIHLLPGEDIIPASRTPNP
jgi:hypothetical protein